MKIALLNIYQGHVDRGSEIYVAEIAKRLKKNHNVTIFSGRKALRGRRWPVLWRAFLDPQSIAIALFTISKLPRILKEKYDIVIPLNGGWQSAFVRLITWLYGGKMVVSGQSGLGWDDRNNLWCFPNRFIALTERAKVWAKKVNPLVKVEKIPNGVNLRQFAIAKPVNIKLPRPIVLSVGALETNKRHELAINAVSKLGKGSLLIVGKGSKKAELQQLGEKLLPGRFKIMAFTHDKMAGVYKCAELFTFPTVSWESFGIVLVEAMAAGLPIVAADDPIRREMVGDAGLFVDPTDINAYAATLEKGLETEWGNKPTNQAQEYSWDKIARHYEKLFAGLILK